MKLNTNTNLSILAEMMGDGYTESDARSFKAYLIDRGVADTDDINDEQFLSALVEWENPE